MKNPKEVSMLCFYLFSLGVFCYTLFGVFMCRSKRLDNFRADIAKSNHLFGKSPPKRGASIGDGENDFSPHEYLRS